MSSARSILGWSRGLIVVVGALVLSACTQDDDALYLLDGPMDVSIQAPNEIFDAHIGFVTNFRSGKIVKLDLQHETYLRDLPYGSWVRAAPIATGDDRLLEQIAVYSRFVDETDYSVTLLASDNSRQQRLVVPYLDSRQVQRSGCLGFTPSIPRQQVCLTELASQLSPGQDLHEGELPVLDAQGNALSGVKATGFWLREGKTSTEKWTLRYDATLGAFQVAGSRSGVQHAVALVGETYYSDGNEIELVIQADSGAGLLDGAWLSFHTDTGIHEIELPGTISDLRVFPDLQLGLGSLELVRSLSDGSTLTEGALLVVDLSPLEWGEVPTLLPLVPLCPVDAALETDGLCPDEVKPAGIDLDRTHGRLFVSDAGSSGGIYEVDLLDPDFAQRLIPGFGPSFDLAYVEDLSSDPGYQHLFVANVDEGNLPVYDLLSDRMLDVNPVTPEFDPVKLRKPISSLAAGQVPVQIVEASDAQVPLTSTLLSVTTFDGEVYAIRGENGCLTFNSPRGAYLLNTETSLTSDQGQTSNPVLVVDGETGELATLSRCGGISVSEIWSFTFDAALGAYQVRGTVTNPLGTFQTRLAYEDERYVSDGGEISVLIRAGTLPTTDGDSFRLQVIGAVAPYATSSHAGDLEIYTQTYGDRNEPWTAVEYRAVAVIPMVANDRVLKLDLSVLSSAADATMAEYR